MPVSWSSFSAYGLVAAARLVTARLVQRENTTLDSVNEYSTVVIARGWIPPSLFSVPFVYLLVFCPFRFVVIAVMVSGTEICAAVP